MEQAPVTAPDSRGTETVRGARGGARFYAGQVVALKDGSAFFKLIKKRGEPFIQDGCVRAIGKGDTWLKLCEIRPLRWKEFRA